MVTLIAVGYAGAEQVLEDEIEQFFDADVTTNPSVAIATLEDKEDLYEYLYLAQAPLMAGQLLAQGTAKKLQDITLPADLKEHITSSFQIKCEVLAEHEWNSQDLQHHLTKELATLTGQSPNYKTPTHLLQCYVYKDKYYFFEDFLGIDIAKRDYNIYTYRYSIKGPLAYTLLGLAEYEPEDILVDPLAATGMFVIEAAHKFMQRSVRHFQKQQFHAVKQGWVDIDFFKDIDEDVIEDKDKIHIHAYDEDLRQLKAIQHNARIAAVDKVINCSKLDPEWMDLKMDDQDVDIILTQSNIAKGARKKIKSLFDRAEHLLSENGRLVLFDTEHVRAALKESSMTIVEEIVLDRVKQQLTVLILEPKR